MEPIPQTAKKDALQKFILLFGVAIAIVFLVCFFAFSTPAGMYRKSIEQFKSAQEEEVLLLNKTDALTTYISKLLDADRSYQIATNVPDREKFKEILGEYNNEISTTLQDLENDSTQRNSIFNRRHANNYLFLFHSLVDYRNEFSSDLTSIESNKDLPRQFRIAIDSMRTYKQQREILRAQLMAALAKGSNTPAQVAINNGTTTSGYDAATKAANEKTIGDLQAQLRQVQVDLNNWKQKALVKEFESPSQGSQPTQASLGQQQIAQTLSDAGKKLYSQAMQAKSFRGGTIEQRGYFACARQVFEEAKSHGSNAEIEDYLKNIDNQIRKLSY